MRRFLWRTTSALAAALGALALAPPPAAAVAGQPAPAPRAALADEGVVASWFSGTIAAGASQDRVWTDTGPAGTAFEVGLIPVGATTQESCQFEVTRTWYTQQWRGGRQFHLTITNTGAIACATNIHLTSVASFRTWSTNGLNPGGSRSWTWNNANPIEWVYTVGLSPTGSTNTDECQLSVTRTWYARQPSGEREFKVTVRNVGDIACQGDVLLARVENVNGRSRHRAVDPGRETVGTALGESSVLVYKYALLPDVPPSGHTCQFQIIGERFLELISNDTGQRSHVHRFDVRNVGNVNCATESRWARLATT
ncbi:MAG TPA: hypothetical protein VFT95_01550 [Micromonosporaceae bacterium]|nr:hypothetical protein [Micromonosporaceae bacterium]